ncbi:beta-N-acetylhexosaminidase [candidate division KSB1 bacterium]
MKRFGFFVMAIVLFGLAEFTFSQTSINELNLMPFPKEIKVLDGKFRLDEKFTISADLLNGDKNRMVNAAFRTLNRLAGRTGIFFENSFVNEQTNSENRLLTVYCDEQGDVKLHVDESYSLIILPEKIGLMAKTDIGIIRGLETFMQLLMADEEGYYFPSVEINDEPRFPWRGLLIDPGRHFMPVDVIKRNLDGMAAVKLNVLHWHLTEDQGFRIECKTFPKLHELGSYGDYYTQVQIKEIIEYAADRGIRIMPEFDMPGHATSWLAAYPEYASAPGPYEIERKWGVKNPTFNPVIDETYEFIDKFFKEITEIFPDEYMHIGGDENNGRQWNNNKDIQDFMQKNGIKDNHELQSYFNKRILEILTKYNKKMVGWDEIYQPDLPKDIVIHSWRGRRAMVESARNGYQTMLSNGYYIDLIQPTSQHYLNDPIPEDSPLTDEEKKFILGGEATMWGEYISPETIDSRIWPRTAAIAERFWSPVHINDVEDMYKRLDIINLQLEELGLLHEKNYEMFLRRLTNYKDITPLKILVDIIEPLKGYNRGRHKPYTQQSPLTRVVDAARPDAKKARDFRKLVDEYLENNQNNNAIYENLKRDLEIWARNHTDLLRIIKTSPVLREIETLSEDLTAVSLIGLESLEMLQKGSAADSKWLEESVKTLEQAKRQRGQTELMILPAIEKLVNSINKD